MRLGTAYQVARLGTVSAAAEYLGVCFSRGRYLDESYGQKNVPGRDPFQATAKALGIPQQSDLYFSAIAISGTE